MPMNTTIRQRRPHADWYNVHGQSTFVYQYHPAFTAPFSGPHSLNPGGMGRETFDATLFAGIRPWQGVELYVNPEIDLGFGLSNTLGVAGFPSGEAYKVGRRQPYYETQRAFGRFTIGLSGPEEKVDDGPNQIAGTRQANDLIITAGKLSATDIFDTNRYAHDPRGDFLNWSIVDSGAYDYAANAWGYTYGGAIEWNQDWWTLRVGYFTLSKVPNEVDLDPSFKQFELVTEFEERHTLFDHPGKVKLLFFNNRGRMANYNDAVRLAQQTGTTPDVSLVRRYASRPGAAINAEQEFTDDLGGFLRASLNDGHKETYEFTEINRSVVAGLALAGKRWSRPNDTFALAGVINRHLEGGAQLSRRRRPRHPHRRWRTAESRLREDRRALLQGGDRRRLRRLSRFSAYRKPGLQRAARPGRDHRLPPARRILIAAPRRRRPTGLMAFRVRSRDVKRVRASLERAHHTGRRFVEHAVCNMVEQMALELKVDDEIDMRFMPHGLERPRIG